MKANRDEVGSKQEKDQRQPYIPDLLYCEASARIDVDALADSLPLAFLSGDSDGSIVRALDEMKVKDTDWIPSVYQDELFLDELIRMCMSVRFDGFTAPLRHRYLKRVISSPPRQLRDVEFRRAVLTELWEDNTRLKQLMLAYRRICHVLRLFDTQGYSSRYEDFDRRLEILSVLAEFVERLASLPAAQAEGLERIRGFAQWVKASDPYRQLTEFLDYERCLAFVDLRLQLGVDGKIRRFEILRVAEDKQNRFRQSALRRLVSRIWLFLRGYRFTETQIVERWIDKVFTDLLGFVPLCLQLKADLEFYFSAIAFRQHCEAKGLGVCLPVLSSDEPASTAVVVRRLFNPLLFSQEIIPVCCDLDTRSGDSMLLVTGPNSGGKTRLLQAVAIAHLFAHVGIYAPAQAAQLRWSTGMFVSLVEGAKLEHSEGRLGTEMLRIRRIFESSAKASLVIIDELCSGTNPSEGEEIFSMVMTLLRELQPLVLITTHFLEFAKRLQSENPLRLEFLQVELNAEHMPTFAFVPGVAESSLAKETAARLGVTRDELVALIERNRR